MANNALAPNIDNVLSDYVYAGRKLKEQRTNNMLNPQVQAALNYIKNTGQKFISLDTPQDMSTGETLTDIGLGFVPVVGTVQGARDFERARRENDYLGMGLSAASMLPIVGGVVKAGEKVAKGSKLVKAVEEIPSVKKDLEGIADTWKNVGVEMDVYPAKADKINLSRIVVDESKRNQGLGTKAMNDLIQYADTTGKTITLSPSTDFGATSVSRLKDFYKQFGFVENKSKNKDFSISDSMYRSPVEKTFTPIKAGDVVDGLKVRPDIPNMGSIKASLSNYEILPGIHAVKISDFGPEGPLTGNLNKLDNRTRNLANEISQSKEINPLIVVYSGSGNYILEGSHRIDALDALNKKKIPVVAVIDKDDPPTSIFGTK